MGMECKNVGESRGGAPAGSTQVVDIFEGSTQVVEVVHR
jgi:hypothetical protein